MPRCVIYARFSTDKQSATSAEDQVRICRERADREGWSVVDVYTDLAISGANIRRPGMTAMLADAAAGSFDIVLVEDLDRVARDQEDSAAIYKRLRFAGVTLFALSTGAIDELHIGLKGTMDALELRKMAEKIRRGQRGCVARGRVPGGLCYGYDVVPELKADGTVERGLRRINEEQAIVVRRIFAEYVSGRSPKLIAHGLNADGIRSARGGEWRASAIVGSRQRRIGILHNPIYRGRLLYNRIRMLRDPESRNRVSRPNAPAEHVEIDLEHLRIVDQATWDVAQEQREARSQGSIVCRRRPRSLLSGLVRCGTCGGNYTVVNNRSWGCTRHREAGTCDNGRRIDGDELRTRVLAGLQQELLSPEAVALAVREYHVDRERRLRASTRSRGAIERRISAAETAIGRLVSAIAEGRDDFPEIRAELIKRRAVRDQARAELAEAEAASVITLHPHIAEVYRERIRALATTFGTGSIDATSTAGQIRDLIDAIVVHPRNSAGCELEVIGSLENILTLTGNKPPRRGVKPSSMVVAEEGLEPPTRGL